MTAKAHAALAAYDRLNDVSTREEHTDTGDAWEVMHLMAEALRAPHDQAIIDQVMSDLDRVNDAHHPECAHCKQAKRRASEQDRNTGEAIVDRRAQVYGDPITMYSELAQMWSAYLGFTVQAWQIPIMMILLKAHRSKTSPDYADNSDDIEGYLEIFRQIIGEDMIHVRSVNEYIAAKWPTDG